ncbi:MAG: PKD domain-containing protein [Lentimicrobium sp.]|nr:PKD domain-containing protein [Lentimicrobium sp.]
MKKLRNILSLTLLSLISTFVSAQQTVFIEGFVLSIENGSPVSYKEVIIGTEDGSQPTISTTDTNGYYAVQFHYNTSDTATNLMVMVFDCNEQPVIRTFPTDSAFQIRADFEICTIATNCLAGFHYFYDPLNPQLVYFANMSYPVSNTATWFWNFGDGTGSSEFEETHEFQQAGIYTVCLTMTDSLNNCVNTYCEDILIDSTGSCHADFTWNTADFATEFNNISTGSPDQYFWDFGDGTFSTQSNPVHIWSQSGYFPVCLTILNSNTQCESTTCYTISVNDSIAVCQANYTYENLQDLTVAFTNLSTGNFDQTIWDFGDGSPFSNETHPVHTWQQAGTYQICLVIISNYTNCHDVICKNIMVGDTIAGCQANFNFHLDSIPGNVNHYWFNDASEGNNISSWFWDFGNGMISFAQNPEVTFSESGSYEVCLTISGQDPGGFCTSTICKTISTPAYSHLGGQIFAGNFPINNPVNTGDTALVSLYRKSGNHLCQVASGYFHEYGYYYFLDVPEGQYIVHAALTKTSSAFNNYIPAYSGETPFWQEAQIVQLSGIDLFEANLHMQQLPDNVYGSGSIHGNLVCIDNSITDLSNRLVFLKTAGNVAGMTYTDINGTFSFANLAYGNYTIVAEIAGFFSSSLPVSLSENNMNALLQQVEISASGIYGIEEIEENSHLKLAVSPNPATDQITIYLGTLRAETCNLKIVSASGSVVSELSIRLQPGDNSLSYNTQNLTSGLYLIMCTTEIPGDYSTVRLLKK